MIYLMLIYARTWVGLVDGGEMDFDQSFRQFNVKTKFMRRVFLDLTLNAEY